MGHFGRLKRGQNGPLGTNVKSASPATPQKTENSFKKRALRREKFGLQNYIQARILAESEFDQDDPDYQVLNALPKVVKCTRIRVAPTVDIKTAPGQNAFYTNLHSCKSVWDCPICSARIMEQRREEIAKTVDWAYNQGHKVIMVTFTAPHYANQECAELLDKFSGALRYFRSGKAWQNFKANTGFEGLIRALETRHGINGWHNHTHELWIVSRSMHLETVQASILDRWEKACKKQGLIPRGKLKAFRKHAVDIIDWASCSDYLAKSDDSNNYTWGVDRELTKGASKKSTIKESLHPFQLVAKAKCGHSKAWDLYVEYCAAFKGKASVFFTPGLKKRAGLDDETDAEIIDRQDAEAEKLLSLDHHAWSQILKEKARAEILDRADRGGLPAVDSWLRVRGLNVHNAQGIDGMFSDVNVSVLFHDPPD